jgi:CRISPR-associated protein Cas1
VTFEKETKLRVPLHNLDGIACFGWKIGCSPQLMAACAQAGITLSFLTPNGKFQAGVVGFTSGNVLLRREQYRRADDPDGASLEIAKNFIAVKIANCRMVLNRNLRDRPDAPGSDKIEIAARSLAQRSITARQARSLDELRGIEGDSAAIYFSVFPKLLAVDPEPFGFTKRTRRPPLDPLNALLSFVYSLLTHDVRSALESCGLDSQCGFLHRDRPGRPSLALDMMEEFRPLMGDRFCLTLINRQQIKPSDFTRQESGAYTLGDKPRKSVLTAWQERKQQQLIHPFLNEKTTVGLLVHLQARLLVRHLRGDIDAYPAFVWR